MSNNLNLLIGNRFFVKFAAGYPELESTTLLHSPVSIETPHSLFVKCMASLFADMNTNIIKECIKFGKKKEVFKILLKVLEQ